MLTRVLADGGGAPWYAKTKFDRPNKNACTVPAMRNRAERSDRELGSKLHELRMTVQRLQQQTEELVEFIQVEETTSRAIQKELVTLEEILAQAHAKNTLLKSQIKLLKEPQEAALRNETGLLKQQLAPSATSEVSSV